MSSTLHDRLAGLADEAPPALPSTGLWARGRRRQRDRRLAAAVAVVVVVALAGGVATSLGSYDEQPAPADTPFEGLHLPRTVNAPSPWAEGTAEAGPPGLLAALSGAPRKVAEGLWGSQEYLSYFGVSAADGSVRFLDLPAPDSSGVPGDQLGMPGEVGATGEVALSPDGRKIGFVRYEGPDERTRRLLGWGIYDTVTGETRLIGVQERGEAAATSYFEIAFTGDSRHLLTRYSRTSPATLRTDELVAWDVETGEGVVVEGPGKYWMPSLGSAPDGVVWSRQRRTHIFDPETRTTTDFLVPRSVVQASWGPGQRSFAYIGHRVVGPDEPATWHLYAGTSREDARRVLLDLQPGRILGWRDATHVVVDDHRTDVRIVDVVTGDAESLELSWHGQLFPAPQYAADLWANELVPGVDPEDAHDPRRPTQLALGVLAILAALAALAGLFAWRRRARA